MANIQRRHRAERRHGDEASPTPSLAELRLRHRSFLPQLNKDNPAAAPAFPPSDSMGNIPLSPSFGMGSIPQSSSFGSAERQASGGGGGDAFGSPLPPDHFVCTIYHVARAYGRRVIAVMVDSEGLLCVWCNFQTTGQNFQRELKWCLSGRHERPRAEFKIPEQEQFQLAHIEHLDEDEEDSCRRFLIRDGILIGDKYVLSHGHLPVLNTDRLSSSFSQQSGSSRHSSPARSPRMGFAAAAATAARAAQSAAGRETYEKALDDNFTNQGPTWDLPAGADTAVRHVSVQQFAVTEVDKHLLNDFYNAIYKPRLIFCGRCNEKWFDLDVRDGICKNCRNTDKDQDVFFYSAANRMDFGRWTGELPKLTQAEEMMISKYHIAIECRQIRGAQYKYSGHVCQFSKDVAKVYPVLPVLPEELDIVIIVPNNQRLRDVQPKEYNVRRTYIKIWLDYLLQHHSEYKNGQVTISDEVLSAVPENGNVMHRFPVQVIGAIDDVDDDLTDEELLAAMENIQRVAVPDLLGDHTEAAAIRQTIVNEDPLQREQRLAREGRFEECAFRNTPINELGDERLYSGAFPCLFLTGDGDYNQVRIRPVTENEQVTHSIKFFDGNSWRFAEHWRYPFTAFNRMLRKRILKVSSFYISKLREGEEAPTVDELRAIFDGLAGPRSFLRFPWTTKRTSMVLR